MTKTKRTLSKTFSVLLTIMLLLSSCLISMPLAVNAAVDTSIFTPYFAANAAEDNPLVSENFDKHWSAEENMVSHKSVDGDVWSSNAAQKLSVLYINTKKYKNFSMTVDYKGYDGHQTTDNMINMFGFGVTDMTKSFRFDDNAFAVNINKYGAILNETNANWLSGAASDQISGWSQTAVHTLTLRVYGNTATYSIDGKQLYSVTLNDYTQPGYIFMATNKMTTQFGVPKIVELSEPTMFTTYYAANAAEDVPLVAESFDKHWSINNNNRAAHKSVDGDVWSANAAQKLSVLYVNTKKYKSFEMTVDYKGYDGHQTTDNMINMFGFGVTDMTKSFRFDDNAFAVNVNKYGGIMNETNANWLSGATSDKVSGWDQTAVHTLKLRVEGGTASYTIDGVQIYSVTLNDYTQPGYIFMATNKMSTQFGIPQITELADTSVFDTYFAANAAEDVPLSAENFGKHWETKGNMVSHKSVDGDVWNANAAQKLSVLYVNTKKYKSFEMTVDYKGYDGHQNTDNMINMFGFGVTDMSKSFRFDDNAFAVNINKFGGIMNETNANWLSGATSDKVSGWDQTAVHTLKLRVEGGKASYTIDGIQIYSVSVSNYTEPGYIFMATNKMTTQFGVPQITELEEPAESLFSAYYAADAAVDAPLTAEAFDHHWSIDDSKIVSHKSVDGDVWSANSSQKLSVLYINTKKYKNFEMSVMYRGYDNHQTTDNMINMVGFGVTDMKKSFRFDDNAVAVNINKFGAIMNETNTIWLSGAASDQISGWDQTASHTLKLRVKDNIATYYIDGIELYSCGIDEYRQEGYIFLATNKMTTKFGVPQITELTATEPDVSLKDSPLYKKSALFIGDSNTYGSHDSISNYGFAGRIGQKYGMDWDISANMGTAVFAENTDSIPQYKNMIKAGSYDYVVFLGGNTDATNSYPLGEISSSFKTADFDTTTFAGGFEEFIALARAEYAGAKLSYIVPYKVSTTDVNEISVYYNLAKEICNKWNVDYIDLYNHDFSTYTTTDALGGTGVSKYLSETFDLNELGYDLISGKINDNVSPIEYLMERSHYPAIYDVDDDGADANVNDIVYLRKVILEIYNATYSCDVNKDSSINVVDLVKLKKYFANIAG